MLSFNSRSRRRKILPEPRPKSAAKPIAKPAAKGTLPPAPRSSRRNRPEPGQLPLIGLVVPPSIEAPYARLVGTKDKPAHYADWKIINEVARAKPATADRHVYPNMDNAVIHLTTRAEYTPEQLVEEFGLSANEAESCFMSFDV